MGEESTECDFVGEKMALFQMTVPQMYGFSPI